MDYISVLGVRIHDIKLPALNDLFEGWLCSNGDLQQIVTVNPEYIMEARKNQPFRECLGKAALALADGVGLVYAARYLYGHKIQRITGVDATLALADMSARTGKSLYLLGAGPGIARRAADELIKRFPELHIAGAEQGPLIDPTIPSQELCVRIARSGASALIVAFGAPKQDLWIASHAYLMPGVRIAMGVGGTFDYLAGAVPHAPRIIRSFGFEWLYRLMRQPWRWHRIFTAVVLFPLAVLFSKK